MAAVLISSLLVLRLPEDFSKKVVFEMALSLNSRVNPNLTRGHLNIRSLSRRYNRLFKGSSKPCSGLSSRDRRENLAWYARPGFPTGWSPPTHQIQELELMFKCPLVSIHSCMIAYTGCTPHRLACWFNLCRGLTGLYYSPKVQAKE